MVIMIDKRRDDVNTYYNNIVFMFYKQYLSSSAMPEPNSDAYCLCFSYGKAITVALHSCLRNDITTLYLQFYC